MRENRSIWHLTWRFAAALVAGGLFLALSLLPTHGVPFAAAHAGLVRSAPADGSIQATPPRRVDLWFSEDLDPRGSTVEVYDAQRQRVDASDAAVDPADPTHLAASLNGLVDGTYAVNWRAASVEDGHLIQGTFTFRVGTARLPGAAASVADRPWLDAVALRWLTLIGLAAVAGWFLLALLGDPAGTARLRSAIAGAVIALLADLALVPVQADHAGAGLSPRHLLDALTALPPAWEARLALELGLVGLVILATRWAGQKLATIGLSLAALAILTVVLTGHAAARETERIPFMVLNGLHLAAGIIWLSGVVQLATAPASWRGRRDLARRFSRLAAVLAPLAIASGVLLAGLTLPSLSSVWRSDYGQTLLIKTAIVLGAMLLAWLNRRRLHAAATRAGRILVSLRAEALLGVGVVLAAALLGFSALPTATPRLPLHLRDEAGPNQFAHLLVDQPGGGRTRVDIWLSDGDNQPVSDVQSVTVDFSMLERAIDLPRQRAVRGSDGRWTIAQVPLTVRGWWRAHIVVGRQDGQPAEADFYLLLPDPSFASAERGRPVDGAAAAWFNSAIMRLGELTSLRSEENLTDGIGNSVRTDYRFQAPDRLAYATASGNDSVAIDADQYYREDSGTWVKQARRFPVRFPSDLQAYYSGATEFTLGRQERVDGELCQIVSFYVPADPGRGEAWYIWWVGTSSHLIRRESMVASHHYMTNAFSDQDAPITITIPEASHPADAAPTSAPTPASPRS